MAREASQERARLPQMESLLAGYKSRGAEFNPCPNCYHVARNFCGSLFLQIGDFFCVLQELIFAIRTDWLFLLGINFCEFRKVPMFMQYPELIIFLFLIVKYMQ